MQTTPSNGARKPPAPRVGNGKRTTMSNYQTVFSVAEPSSAPVMPVPSVSSVSSAPLDPQLTSAVTQQPPPLQSPAVIQQQQQQHQNRASAYGWQQGLTPTTATPPSGAFDNDVVFKTEQQQQQGLFSPYTPVSQSFNQVTSPISSYPNGNGQMHSPSGPPSLVTSPTAQYDSQQHSSPTQQYHNKSFHTPPPILTSPTKRLRTSTSPIQAPPHSPYTFEHINARPTATMAPIPTSLGTALDYISPPISNASINHIAGMMDHHHHPAGVGTGMRRVSVENLLAPPLPDSDHSYDGSYVDRYPSEMEDYKREDLSQSRTLYGVDRGEPDMDNDDDDVEEIPRHDYGGYDDGMMMMGRAAGFYGNDMSNPFYPVAITIPRKLDPLPQLLLDNRKNMMYFHHYLHYTARLLVPHDCSANPFKSILPQSRFLFSLPLIILYANSLIFLVAVQTDHLMNLLLAYSASHRARLLEHPEPTERIGRFLDETVRSLHSSLDNPEDAKSDSTLATAIMLSSYQIISPNPFSMSGLTWQTHLSAARKIILARGGAQGMHSRDKVSYFLVRWFAYLDLLGSLSGRDTEEPIFSGKYWTNDDGEGEAEEYAVDCFFGFTSRCVSILAKIGELARRCEQEKREYAESLGLALTNQAMRDQSYDQWTPTPAIFQAAIILQRELEDARGKAVGNCTHSHHHHVGLQHYRPGSPSDNFDTEELLAMNDSFHWAALIHLYRRVLNYHTQHPRVQQSVAQIVRSMGKVRPGGTAENCLLFPLFSAGCEAVEGGHREYTLKRMIEVEKSGLVQVCFLVP